MAASGFIVENGGFEVVRPGGTVAGTVAAGGTLILAGGGNSGLVVQAGGVVVSGGIVFRDGLTGVSSAATTFTGNTISGPRATQYVLSGGVASDTMLISGGTEYVYSGGTSLNDMIVQNNNESGEVIAFSGGIVSNPTVLGGFAEVSGGMFFGATVGSGGGGPGQLYLDGGETSGTMIESGGTEYVSLGLAAATTIENGATLTVGDNRFGLSGPVPGSDNTTIMSGGAEYLVDGAVGSNTTIEGGRLSLLPFNPDEAFTKGVATGALDFVGGGGQALLDISVLPNLVVSGLTIGDSIFIYDAPVGAESATMITPGTLTLNFGSSSYDLAVAGAASNTHFVLEEGGLTVGTPCFAAGTRVLTPRGEIPVEELAVGDMVITGDGDDAPIIWIGRRRIDIARHPHPRQVRPIRIAAEAFADGVPSRDLLLSPDHALFLHGALIPAKALLNDRNIQQLNRAAVTYYHVELGRHAIIFAENCAVESYLETGNRGAFENAAAAMTLHPDFAQSLREKMSCAPFNESGPLLEAAREQTLRQFYSKRRIANE